MSDLALDPATGDLLLEGGRARLVQGAEAVAQLWRAHLTMFKGEWFRDRTLGIDYQNEVLEKGIRPAVHRALFAGASREVPGIADVRDLTVSLDRKSRTLTVKVDAILNTGEVAPLSLSEPIG